MLFLFVQKLRLLDTVVVSVVVPCSKAKKRMKYSNCDESNTGFLYSLVVIYTVAKRQNSPGIELRSYDLLSWWILSPPDLSIATNYTSVS